MKTKLLCPEHKVLLSHKNTKYGGLYFCPVENCTVALWEKDETATPADKETRQARLLAHNAFDPLWKSRKHNRSILYQLLSDYLGIPKNKTHIGMFDFDTCHKVVEFVKELK